MSQIFLYYNFECMLGNKTQLMLNKKNSERKVIKEILLQGTEGHQDRVKISGATVIDLRSAHIVNVDSTFVSGSKLHIVSEYCEGGSLHDLIVRARRYSDVLSETEILDWFIQIAKALSLIHSRGYIYGSLNAKNVLLKDNEAKLSITRLLSRQFDPQAACSEAQTNGLPSQCSLDNDMWSLGCTLYHLCTRHRHPQYRDPEPSSDGEDDSGGEDNNDIGSQREERFPDIYSLELSALCTKLLIDDSAKRLTIQQILEDPFVSTHMQDTKQTAAITDTSQPTEACVRGRLQ